MKPKHANPSPIPAKRYFSITEACAVIGVSPEQLQEWQRQEGMILGKGARTLTRLDVLKLRQLQHGIATEILDKHGNPAISNQELHTHLSTLLHDIEKTLAKHYQ